MKNNKQYKDLEKIKTDQAQQNQSFQPQAQQAPLDQLTQKLGSIEQDIRRQQLETETSLQGAFSQAAGGLADVQAVNQLMQVLNQLSSLTKNQGLQGPAADYNQLLGQLDTDLRQQIQAGSEDVVQNLQQGITALAQANAALLNSQKYHQVLHYVHQCQLLLANWEGAGSTQIH